MESINCRMLASRDDDGFPGPRPESRATPRRPCALALPALAIALALALALALFLAPGAARAEMRHIFLDGSFADWEGLAPLHVDPSGDGGSSGIDLGGIWAADDDEQLYLRFGVGAEMILQDSNQLALYIDGDNNPATGFPISGLGAELRWTFGDRSGYFFYGGGWIAVEWAEVGLVSGPTHSGGQFEVALSRGARPDGQHALFTGAEIRLLLHDLQGNGDWAPNAGSSLAYLFDQGVLEPLPVLDLESGASGALRLVTYNVEFDGLFEAWKQPSFQRILQAIDPDVIAFQEIYDHSASQTRTLVQQWLGGTWAAQQVSDKVLLTRGALPRYWSLAGGRAGAFLLSPLGVFTDDLLIINAHLSCCGNDPARQAQADAIMAFVRDARTVGGELDLDPANPIIITGDMNFVGLVRQLLTLLTGDIADEGTYGPDFAPDWDETSLADVFSRQPSRGWGYTWYDEGSGYSPGRLDFIITSDSNLRVPKNLILQTSLLPQWLLDTYGLAADDTDRAADHLPHFVDLMPVPGAVPEADQGLLAGARLLLSGPHPARGDVHLRLRFAEDEGFSTGPLDLSIRDAQGRRVRVLPARGESPGVAVYRWDGRDDAGRALAAGTYWIAPQGRPGIARRVVLVR